MKSKISVAIVVALILFGVGRLYVRDAATVEQAVLVEQFLQEYCRQHGRYPDISTLESQFPELYPDGEWYYWPNEAHSLAAFQYPMTLPLGSAPGRSKLSEFFPVIYSYAVQHPCDGIF